MDVGLFGGSFNPPHLAHLIVAETIREQFALDEVWWMPAHTPPHNELIRLQCRASRDRDPVNDVGRTNVRTFTLMVGLLLWLWA